MTKTENNAAVLRAHTQDWPRKTCFNMWFCTTGGTLWFLGRKIFFLRNTTNCISFESELNADYVYWKILAKNSRFTKLWLSKHVLLKGTVHVWIVITWWILSFLRRFSDKRSQHSIPIRMICNLWYFWEKKFFDPKTKGSPLWYKITY